MNVFLYNGVVNWGNPKVSSIFNYALFVSCIWFIYIQFDG